MRDQILTQRAREMRKDPSDAEVRMWLPLRARRFAGIKFRKQKVIGPYIVDFAAREPMVVVEIDGATHAGRESYGAARTDFLEAQGYRVVRFSNSEIMTNLEGVLETLERALRTAPLPTLSPEGERAP